MTDKYLMDGHKLNWHLNRVEDWMNGKRIAPVHIDVGLSKGCNIQCEYCFGVLQGNFYKKGSDKYFPREALLQYVRSAGEVGVRSMAFIGEAEPLLNPHVYEAIVEGKKAGVDISLGTNGILLDTSELGVEALKHLSWIRFNISAASKDSYKKIHRSNDFHIAVEKIQFAVDIKKEYNLDITVGLQMVLTPNNINEVIPLAKLGKELGVDYFVIKQCSDTIENALGVFKKLDEYDNFNSILEEAESISSKTYNVIAKWKKIENKGNRNYDKCLGVPFLLYSSGDGKLYPCGMFFDYKSEEYLMGDLTTQTFKEIIESERYQEVIEKVKEIDVKNVCYSNCRTHCINEFLWALNEGEISLNDCKPVGQPPEHVNFV